MENNKLVCPSDAISAILKEKISGQQLEIMHLIGVGMQAETLNQACDRHAQYIRDLPAVDAVEMRHGRWEGDYPQAMFQLKRCSVCETLAPEGWYCFFCGACMDGEEEHNAID